jgi:hypothetical protein
VRCPGKQLNPPKLANRPGFGREDKSSFVLIQGFLWRARVADSYVWLQLLRIGCVSKHALDLQEEAAEVQLMKRQALGFNKQQ